MDRHRPEHLDHTGPDPARPRQRRGETNGSQSGNLAGYCEFFARVNAAIVDRQTDPQWPDARTLQFAADGHERSAVDGKDRNERIARGSRRSWAPGDPGAFCLHENVAFRPLRSCWRVEDNRDIAVFVISAGPRMSP